VDLGALPGVAWMLSTEIGKDWQDSAGEAVLAAIRASFSMLAHQVVLL
jgi:hypothetical protein